MYTVLWAMSGYLDNSTYEFDTLYDAKQFMLNERLDNKDTYNTIVTPLMQIMASTLKQGYTVVYCTDKHGIKYWSISYNV